MAKSYVGVFEVPTPAVAHSGLSHLAEHLCFRGSQAYPADHELFIINHLLPASINATTLAEHTYFFVTTVHQALFQRLLDYLYHGLVQHQYGEDVITAEKLGVITQELKMYESNPHYAINGAIRRGDKSKQAYQHAGGFTDTIAHITTEDVLNYKKTYYQADQIRLYTNQAPQTLPEHLRFLAPAHQRLEQCNEDPETNQQIEELTNLAPSDLILSPRVALPKNNKNSHQSRVITWWIPEQYLASAQSRRVKWQSDLEDLGQIWIDDEINPNRYFAFRLMLNDQINIEQTTTRINPLLKELKPMECATPDGTEKLPEEVRSLIQAAIANRLSSQTKPSLTCQSIQIEPELSYLYPITPNVNIHDANVISTSPHHTQTDSSISSQFEHLLSLDNLPALPKLFQGMLEKADVKTDCITPLIHKDHWLHAMPPSDALLKQMMTPAFWFSRLAGECYALGVGQHQDKYYLYCAQDLKAANRFAQFQTI